MYAFALLPVLLGLGSFQTVPIYYYWEILHLKRNIKMKLALMILGGLIIAFGLVDLAGSYANFDLWGGIIGIQLPEMVWKYSSYGEIVVGVLLFKAGNAMSKDTSEEAIENA